MGGEGLAPGEEPAGGEAVARRIVHTDPLYCVCDPRQRTGWTHDRELNVHVCSACRRPSRENARRLAAGQPATQVMTEAISVPAGNGAVAYVPSRIQPEPLPAIAPTPAAVSPWEHGRSVAGGG